MNLFPRWAPLCTPEKTVSCSRVRANQSPIKCLSPLPHKVLILPNLERENGFAPSYGGTKKRRVRAEDDEAVQLCGCQTKQPVIFGRLSSRWNFAAMDLINTGVQKNKNKGLMEIQRVRSQLVVSRGSLFFFPSLTAALDDFTVESAAGHVQVVR